MELAPFVPRDPQKVVGTIPDKGGINVLGRTS
jgi:hypothetical protein